MKFALSSLATLLALPCSLVHAGDLTIHVDDVKRASGQVLVALYNREESFMKTPLLNGAATALQGSTSVVFKDVPAGEYAFAVVHDANGNGKMDRNLVGLPTEDYAFSNNAVGKMGPASYADAKFSLPATGAAVRVSLR